MSSNYSGRTTPHSDVDHPHRITYSPFREEEDPQPIPIATYTNPTTRNIYASSNHLDLTVDPKLPSNKSHLPHHHSPFESHIREDSKQENPHPPSHHPPRPPLPAEKSPRTREKEERNTSPVNKERSKGTSTELSTISKGSGTEGWRNSPKTKTNPTNTTTKPSETSTKSHMDFRILMEISDRRRRVMLRFHFLCLPYSDTPYFFLFEPLTSQ